ncbi:MAG: exodeoxyribonuclease III [Minwuia sp.]|uniref:exodeoxyribonuclease III n=1 Tax=Minwuia sp. TaxID=2493630 RepID=UPI003A87C71E
MANVRIATWNINSVRLRLPIVEQFVAEHDPDILCLQEIKVENEKFPFEAFREMGYREVEVFGQKGYHGVATVSKYPFQSAEKMHWCGKDDTRHLVTTLEDNTEIHNFYVPAGGDEPDPEINDKFAHKLQFLDEVTSWFGERRQDSNRLVVVGDLNIAPHENDVWSHKQLLKVVSHTPIEVEAMSRWFAAHDFHDVVRQFVPETEKLYSWWSYRARDWDAADRGRRLDHIWVTQNLKPAVKGMEIHRPARGWVKPSDHVPVIADMDLPL